ncbi:MAG: hypothetical protein RIQ59_576 [Bacteroidota bacterium]|jgi:hypothetical protein
MSENKTKIKIKTKTRTVKGIEGYSSLVFRIVGIGLLLYSGYFYLSFQKELLNTFFNSLFSHTDDVSVIAKNTSMGTYVKLLLRFVPSVLISLLCYLGAKKYPIRSYYLNLISILALTVSHTQLFFHKYFMYETCHSNYFITSLFFIIPLVIFFMNYSAHNRPLVLTFISLFFYSFIFQLVIAHFSYIFIFGAILIYSTVFYFLSQPGQHFKSNLINSLFAYSFLGIFVLRKLYVGQNESFLPIFYVASFLYFSLFFLVGISFSKINVSVKHLFHWSNTLAYIGVNAIVIGLFYGFWYFVPVLIALLVHLVALYFIDKFKFENTKNSITIELPSLVLISLFAMSLWLPYAFELFFGCLSILLIIYYQKRELKYIYWSALVSLQLVIVQFVYLLLSFYVPALALFFNPSISMLERGLVTSILLLLSVYGVNFYLKSMKDKISTKWFSQRNFSQFLSLFFLLNLFIFIEWVCFSLLIFNEGSIIYFHSLFFIIGFIYAIYLLFKRYKLPPKFKTAICYSLYFFAFLMPIFGFFKFPYTYINRLEIPDFLSIESALHYIELLLCIVLLIKGFVINHNKEIIKKRKKFFEVTLGLIGIVLLCKEYDYLFLLNNFTNTNLYNLALLSSMIIKNRLLPYSSIMLFSATVLLLVGMLRSDKFIRIFSLVLIGFALIKVFYLEFNLLTEEERFGSLVLLGITFLLISWIYKKVKVRRRRVSR